MSLQSPRTSGFGVLTWGLAVLLVVLVVLAGVFMARDRIWPQNGPGPGDQTIPSTGATGVPTLPVPN